MPPAHPRPVAATVSGLAGCLLLTACGSSSAPTHAVTPSSQRASVAARVAARPGATHRTTAVGASSGATRPVTAAAAACSLITEADVAAAVGTDPGRGGADSQRGATVCVYGSYPKPVLTVNVLPARGRAGYDGIRHNPKITGAPGTRVATVATVGDQAFELSGPHMDVIYFTKGEALIVIGFTTPTSPHRGVALSLAKIAAGRL